jgi:hypothetical protein
MIRHFDTAKVVPHPRFAALGETAQVVYLRALRDASPVGWLARRDLDVFADRPFGRAALRELADAGLLAEVADLGAHVHLPQVLDRAAQLDADLWEAVAERTRAHWSSVNAEVTAAATAAGVLDTLPQDEWDVGWDALAVRAAGGEGAP